MGQHYIDNKTNEAFRVLFEGDNKPDLEKQMADMQTRLTKTSTLMVEATGETADDVRAEIERVLAEYKKA